MGWKKLGDKVSEFDLPDSTKFDFKFVEMAARLKACGFSHADLAYAMGVADSTIAAWAKKHEQFYRALNEGKDIAKSHLVAKAFKAAGGYEYEEENIKYNAEGQVTGRSIYKKHQTPNPKLIMWLLCNMSPDEWKSEHKILVENNETMHVRLDGKMASKQIEALAGKLLAKPGKAKKKVIIEREEDGS